MNKKNSNLFMFIAITYTTCLLIANITAFKLFQLGPWTLTAGVLVFPITYIVNDLISEVYGFKKASKIIWAGFAMNLLMVLYFRLAIILPYPVYFTGQEAFTLVLGGTWRILIASLTAYLIGSMVNSWIMSKMKVKTNGKYLALRAIISTMGGEFIDSILFVLIAFLGIYDTNMVLTMILTQTAVKTLFEILVFPLTKRIILKVKEVEGIDTFDRNISYNPFTK